MTAVFVALLGVWSVCSVLRFVRMYEPDSRWQRWRRWDVLQLVPVGAFFSPGVPPVELVVLARHLRPDGRRSAWRELAPPPRRSWRHLVWNPGKVLYRARTDAARGLVASAAGLGSRAEGLAPSLLLDENYLRLLRLASQDCPDREVCAVQFAVLVVCLEDGRPAGHVLSGMHELVAAGS